MRRTKWLCSHTANHTASPSLTLTPLTPSLDIAPTLKTQKFLDPETTSPADPRSNDCETAGKVLHDSDVTADCDSRMQETQHQHNIHDFDTNNRTHDCDRRSIPTDKAEIKSFAHIPTFSLCPSIY